MVDLCFIDCETTGLDPARHVPWEIALIDSKGIEHVWILYLGASKIGAADAGALRVGGYYSRGIDQGADGVGAQDIARTLAQLTDGKHLVGMNPSFDARFVGDFMLEQGYPPAWNYHLVDVEALVAGKLGVVPPWRSSDLSEKIGIHPTDFDRHTALGDARWARAVYCKTMGVNDRIHV